MRFLDQMRRQIISWAQPCAKGGRCRRAPRVTVLWSVLDAVEALFTTMCGDKRPTDLLWTKYLPAEVPLRLLRGPPFWQLPTTYFHWVVRAADARA